MGERICGVGCRVYVRFGGECVTPGLVRSLKHTCPQPVTGLVSRLVFTGSIPVLHTNIWSQHLVKQLWPPDGCRRTEGRLSKTLAAKSCVLSTKQERSFKWDWSKWVMMKKGLVDKLESLMLPAIGTWGYPIRADRC